MLKQYEISDCPIETTLTLLGDRTGILIIYNLLSGPKRLCELSKSITSVSKKMITQRLRIMEETGLITRTIFPEVPSRVEYNLTEVGKTLEPIIETMKKWGTDYKKHRN